MTFSQYQSHWIQKITTGFGSKELMVISTGRQTGKSYYQKTLLNQQYGKLYDTNLCKEIMLPTEPMKNSKYQFSRAKWYEVHMMFKSYAPIQERIDWCVETFGPLPKNPDAWTRWYLSGLTKLKFRDSKDYEWFMLRWS